MMLELEPNGEFTVLQSFWVSAWGACPEASAM